jgi:hypothetical protein
MAQASADLQETHSLSMAVLRTVMSSTTERFLDKTKQ